jgi:hypothetical protein
MGLLQSRINNARLERENRDLSRTVNYLDPQNNQVVISRDRLYNFYDSTIQDYNVRKDSLNQQINRLNDLNVKYTKQLNDLKAMRDPDIALIHSYDDKLIELQQKISELKRESTDLFQNQFNTIQSQNIAIEKQYGSVADEYLHYDNKFVFYIGATNTVKYIHSVLLFIYYILALYLIYIVFFKQWKWAIYYKFLFVFFFMGYPYFIHPIEKSIYNSWIYVLAILTGTPYHTYSASNKDIMKKSTNLSTDK